MSSYHAMQGVRATSLKALAKGSPRHFLHAQSTQGDGSDDTASRRWLRAVHCAALEPQRFEAAYQVYAGGARRGAQYDLWRQARPSIEAALTPHEGRLIEGILARLRDHEDASRILWGSGWSEVVRQWTDPASGVMCKAQIDRVIPVSASLSSSCGGLTLTATANACEIWDLKTLDAAHPDAVRYHVRKQLFALQLAHYRAGVKNCQRCGLIVVEGRPPHDVGVYEIDPLELEAAEEQRCELLELISDCVDSGVWPGVCPSLTTLSMDPDDLGEIDTDNQEI